MTIRKVNRKGPDGIWREAWEADGRYRGKGKRKFCHTRAEALAYAERYGRLAKARRRLPTDKSTVGEFVTALLEKRRGTCAEATFDVAHTQLGHFTSYEVRPGLTIKEMR